MSTCLDVNLQNLHLVQSHNYTLYFVHATVDVHIKEQPSTKMHGFTTIATASLLGGCSHTWIIQPLDELLLAIKFHLMESKTNMAHLTISIPHDTLFEGVKTLLQREHIKKGMHVFLGLTTGT